MSSSSAYTYQKPSTIATRALVTGTKPAETVSSGSHNSAAHDQSTLQRETTDHYDQAVRSSSKGVETDVGADAATAPTKPVLDRQQSWKHSDMKRGAMEKMLGGQPGAGRQGYTSTST